MPTDMREQIRQLTAAFDAFVSDVTVDEVIGRVEQPSAVDELAVRRPASSRHTSQIGWPRRGLTVAAVALVVGLVAALMSLDPSGSDTASEPSLPVATAGSAPSVPIGQFVWPAPPRGYATPNELITAFTSEVLQWTAFDIDGDVKEERQPQTFNLTNSTLHASVPVIALPSSDGWGFAQIGFGLNASLDDGTVVLDFPSLPSVTSSSITVRLSDGTAIDTTATTDRVEIPAIELEQLLSALVVGHDGEGNTVVVAGGQFIAASPDVSATLPAVLQTTTISAGQATTETIGPLDYATTEGWLPRWPVATASDPPATTSGYGMNLCDSGYGTKVLRLDSTAAASHAYSGTLCLFIELDEARAEAVVTCATSSEGYTYARCAGRTDQIDTTGPGEAVDTVASDEQRAAMAAFPGATALDQTEVFDVEVRAADGPDTLVDYQDDQVAVTLRAAVAATDDVYVPGVCFDIDLPGATANGCVGRSLLATGLAYGAFQNGDGPIELVGIVPNDVTSIEIDGTILTPTNNIWHRTITGITSPRITVRSTDGRATSTT